jgi:glyoxylase-like metal-dependent hydrolase (beta-lactamase superfamily II)
MAHQWNWRLLRAGSFRLDGGGMFGVVPKSIWSRFAPPDAHNRIALQTNCLLLDDGSTKALIETGFGGKWSDKERGFYDLERRTVADALREAGIDPAEIDHVIVTHLHFDHAAGLTAQESGSAEPMPVFPNAAVHVQKREWEDALANRSTMTRTYLRTHLDPVAGRVRLADGEAEILPGIRVRPMPGHTWGQQAVRFADAGGIVCFPGDVMPTANHANLAFSMGYDMEPYTNMLSKRDLLERAAGEGWRLALDHEPDSQNTVVRVARDAERPERFTLEPIGEHG